MSGNNQTLSIIEKLWRNTLSTQPTYYPPTYSEIYAHLWKEITQIGTPLSQEHFNNYCREIFKKRVQEAIEFVRNKNQSGIEQLTLREMLLGPSFTPKNYTYCKEEAEEALNTIFAVHPSLMSSNPGHSTPTSTTHPSMMSINTGISSPMGTNQNPGISNLLTNPGVPTHISTNPGLATNPNPGISNPTPLNPSAPNMMKIPPSSGPLPSYPPISPGFSLGGSFPPIGGGIPASHNKSAVPMPASMWPQPGYGHGLGYSMPTPPLGYRGGGGTSYFSMGGLPYPPQLPSYTMGTGGMNPNPSGFGASLVSTTPTTTPVPENPSYVASNLKNSDSKKKTTKKLKKSESESESESDTEPDHNPTTNKPAKKLSYYTPKPDQKAEPNKDMKGDFKICEFLGKYGWCYDRTHIQNGTVHHDAKVTICRYMYSTRALGCWDRNCKYQHPNPDHLKEILESCWEKWSDSSRPLTNAVKTAAYYRVDFVTRKNECRDGYNCTNKRCTYQHKVSRDDDAAFNLMKLAFMLAILDDLKT